MPKCGFCNSDTLKNKTAKEKGKENRENEVKKCKTNDGRIHFWAKSVRY